MMENLENNMHSTYETNVFFKQLTKRKSVKWALRFLLSLVLVALLAPLLANEKPLFMKYQGQYFFPALWDINPFAEKNFYEIDTPIGNKEKLQLDIVEWKKLELQQVLWCPIPYSPGKSDYANSNFVSPFAPQYWSANEPMPWRFRHFLGTGLRGEDVFAGLIHGTRISLSVGILAMLLAAAIGLFLGALAGYYGDYSLRTSPVVLVVGALGAVLGFFYAFHLRSFILSDAFAVSPVQGWLQLLLSLLIFLMIVLLFLLVGKWIQRKIAEKKVIYFPLDSGISRLIEILLSLPNFILILSFAAITKASMLNLIFIIAFSSWTGIARLTRAEILRIKKLDYIQAAKALGYSEQRIIIRHALLNGIAPALVAISFGIASTILIESSLSFLGIGLPLETVTWGSMLSEGRHQFSAWWMSLFPGIALFICVTTYNFLGDALRELR